MQRQQIDLQFPLPDLLERLLASGVWPSDGKTAMKQNFQSIVPPERVRLFAPEQNKIYFEPPPFRTLAQEIALVVTKWKIDSFWSKFGALSEIVPAKVMIIGDFGMGSDAPIVLNYALSVIEPPVYRLRWEPDCPTHWVKSAANFSEFASILGLTDRIE